MPMGFRIGGPSGPGVTTNFDANWNANDPAVIHFGVSGNSTNPADGFGPVNFEMGDFIRGIIGPVIQNIKQYNPLPKDLIDFMNKKLPVFNETPAEVLGNVFGHPEIALLFKIAGVVTDLSNLPTGDTINLSAFSTPTNTEPNTGTRWKNGAARLGPISASPRLKNV